MKIKIEIPDNLPEVYRAMLKPADPVPPAARSAEGYRRSEQDRGLDRLLDHPQRLARLETVLQPEAGELEAAPSLEDWSILYVSEEGCWFAGGNVVGSTEGLRDTGDGLVISGKIRSVDVERRWVRDDVRLYRLGKRD